MAAYDTDEDVQFVRMVLYFFREKGDPTRFSEWDEERCKQLMPVFYISWCQLKYHQRIAELSARDAEPEDY